MSKVYKPARHETKSDTTEFFQCNECGETWTHTGENTCPFCKSKNTGPIDDEKEPQR